MKFSKIFSALLLIALFACCAQAVNINSQSAFNSLNWTLITSTNPAVLSGSYYLNAAKTIGNGASIRSNDTSWRTITSSGTHRMFTITSGTITFSNIILSGGQYAGNSDTQGGGAIYVSGSTLAVSGSVTFQSNTSSASGGAVYVNSGSTTFNGGTVNFTGNKTQNTGSGGAIYTGGSLAFGTTSYLTMTNNEAALHGGAVYTNGAITVSAASVTINGNTATTGNGGGIFASGNVNFNNTRATVVIDSNSADVLGGGIFSSGTVTFTGGASITANHNTRGQSATPLRKGGGIYANGNVSFTSATATIVLQNNSSNDYGGAIFTNAAVTFSGSANISGNSSVVHDGGAVYAVGNVNFNNNNGSVTLASNSASSSGSGSGGAIFSSGTVTVNSYINASWNSASASGGVIAAKNISVRDGGVFENNSSKAHGGAIFLYSGTSSISALARDVVFTNNVSSVGRNDIHLNSTGSAIVLNLTANAGRSIIFNGGITNTSGGTFSSTVNKLGAGYLVLNGSFTLQNFNVQAGTVTLGANSYFYALTSTFAVNTFIDMRNNNSSDVYYGNYMRSSALLYFDMDSDSSASDLINVNTANMAGSTVKVGIHGVDSSTKTYTLIKTANNSSGAIGINKMNVEGSTMTRVNANIIYDTGNSSSWRQVDLVMKIDQLNALGGLSDNQMQTALALDSVYGNAIGDLFYIIDYADQQPAAVRKQALTELSGHIYANAITIPAFNAAKNSVLSRLKKSYFLADDSVTKRNIWVQGYGASNKYKGDDNSPGDFSASNSGVQAGFDTMQDEKQIFGISFGFVNTASEQNDDKVDINGYSVGGYGSYFFDNNLELKMMVMGAKQDYSSTRNIKYLPVTRIARADFEGYSINTSAELGYDYFYKENLYFRPFAGLDYSYVSTREFSENGADSADLTLYGGSYNRANGSMGMQINNGTDMRWKWYGEMRFDMLFAGRAGKFEGEFKNTNQQIEILGIENDVFNIVIGGGVLFDISSSFSAYANVNGMFSGTQTGYYGNLGINYKFSTQGFDFYEK